jgi:hypothetical protein
MADTDPSRVELQGQLRAAKKKAAAAEEELAALKGIATHHRAEAVAILLVLVALAVAELGSRRSRRAVAVCARIPRPAGPPVMTPPHAVRSDRVVGTYSDT